MRFFGSKNGNGAAMTERFAEVQQVRAYWQALREGGALPRRDAIDPRGLSSALEHVFLVERIAPGQGRFRLAGMHLNDLMGMEVRGMPLSSLIEPSARARLATALEAVFTGSEAQVYTLESERGIGRPTLEGRMLLLPLLDQRGAAGLALGCLATHGDLGRSPRRFAISGIGRETFTPPTPVAVMEPGFAETGFAEPAPPPFQPAPPRGKPQLRLVSSRD